MLCSQVQIQSPLLYQPKAVTSDARFQSVAMLDPGVLWLITAAYLEEALWMRIGSKVAQDRRWQLTVRMPPLPMRLEMDPRGSSSARKT